jgi:predicted DNA binding CopG/RHH family protein
MKTKNEVIYEDEPVDEGWDFDRSRPLTPEEQTALGLPTPEEARHLRMVRKVAKGTRINVRLSDETVAGLKARAAEAGMPYQTLAASVLHLVATGRLRLELVAGRRTKG